MEKNEMRSIGFKNPIPFSLLFFIILLIYSNTFNAEWHLDDYSNITLNSNIHIKDIGLKSLGNTFYFKKTDKRISRPLARLTFALNWYIGKDNVVGYHIVNTFIHLLAAFFLFLFILKLFDTPNLKDKFSENDGYFIAMLSAVLWATHPIQTQAVTYIVQRMASMAAMFYIMSMYFYLKGRIEKIPKRKTLYFLLTCVSFGFGLATKENAATLPIAILLTEVIFFQDIKNPKTQKKLLKVSAFLCGVVILCGSWLFLDKGLSALFKGSGFRYFTPVQRLMTEARVMVFYLSEIFYPVPTQFSIEHDFAISTSLLKPWTTIPAILFIVFLIFFGILQCRKKPLLSFGILFFFLNHLIESTVLGLEIIFEHRNYLPSFFLFLYVSEVIKWMLDQYYAKNKLIHNILAGFVVFMIMSFGISTYVRNMDWKTEESILEDAVRKAPNSARPLSNLARIYYNNIRRSDIALKMYQKALTLNKTNTHQESIILYSIGKIYYDNGHENKAIPYFQKAIKKPPHHPKARYQLAVVLAKIGKYKESKKHLDKINRKSPYNINATLNLKGVILAKEKKYKDAFHQFRKCLGIRSFDKNALLNIGALYFFTGDYHRAETFFKIAYTRYPNERFALLWLVETNLKINDHKDVRIYTDKLLLTTSAKGILVLPEALADKNTFERGMLAPPPTALLIKEISNRLNI